MITSNLNPVLADVAVFIDQDGDDIPETNITTQIVSAISIQNGNTSLKDSDRASSAGNMTLEIENASRAYTGIDFIGKAISVQLSYGDSTKQVYFGRVDAPTDDDSGTTLPLHIKLSVPDWLDVANNTRMTGLSLATFKRANEALDLLMAVLVTPPRRTWFDVGTEVFANMFDGSGPKAKIFSELDKIAKSELGQLYMMYRQDGDGDVLRLENAEARGSSVPLSRVPVRLSDAPLLMYHGNAGASGFLKYHKNGVSGYIKVHRAKDADFGVSHYDSDWKPGKIIANQFSGSNVFRNTDASNVILYKLTYPLEIGTGEVITLEGNYSDPNGGNVIAAFDITVLDADILFNSNSDGTGTDLKVNLQNAGFAYYPNKFMKKYRNTGPKGYLRSFIVRGKGIYKYSPNETFIENLESQQELRNVFEDSLTREYSNSVVTTRAFGLSVVALRRKPNLDLLSVSYHSITSEDHLARFMYLDQGSKIRIQELHPSHTGDFYIQGIRAKIEITGEVDYTYYVREEVETLCTPLAVVAPSVPARVSLDYGILPRLANLPAFSYSAWIRRTTTSAFGVIVSRSVDTGSGRRGNYFMLSGRTLIFISHKTPTDGTWQAINQFPADLNWHHVAVTYDNLRDTADPIMYVDKVPVTVTETATPVGVTDDDSDCPLMLFNLGPNPLDFGTEYYYDVVRDYILKDVRVYKDILDQAKITELGNGPDDYSTLVKNRIFCGPFAPTANLSDYVGDTLEAGDLTLEIGVGSAGVPYAQDTSSSTLMLTGTTI